MHHQRKYVTLRLRAVDSINVYAEKASTGVLLSQQMLHAIKRVVDDNIVFEQDTPSVHLAFNTVQLLQCKTVNFLFS